MSHSLINVKLMGDLIERRWVLWLVFFSAWFFGLVLPLFLYTNDFVASGATTEVLQSTMATAWFIEYFAAIAGTVLAGAVSVCVVWEPLFNKAAATFYGSAPLSRKTIFGTFYLAGLLPLIVIELVVALMTLVVALMFGAMDLTYCLNWLLLTVSSTVIFYTMAVICGQLTGSRAVLVAIYLALLCGVGALEFTAESIISLLLPNVVFTNEPLLWFSPALALVFYGFDGADPNWVVTSVYLLISIPVGVGAAALNGRRNLESAAEIAAYPWVAGAFKFICALFAGVFVGTLMVFDFGGSNDQAPVGYAIFVALSVSAACVLGLVLSESAMKRGNVWKRSWKQSVAAVCVVCLFVGVSAQDVLGMRSFVPDASNVSSVRIAANETMELAEKGNVERAIQIHRDLMLLKEPEGTEDMASMTTVEVAYTMSDGEEVARKYKVWADADASTNNPRDVVADELEELASTNEALDSRFSKQLNASAKGFWASLEYQVGDQWKTVNLDSDDYSSFVSAVKRDMKKTGAAHTFLFGYNLDTEGQLASVRFGTDDVVSMEVTKSTTPETIKWFKNHKGLDLTQTASS